MKTVVVIGSGNVAEALAGAIAASPYGLAAIAPATGPARRGDMPTQKRHLDLLDGYPELQNIYENISRHIWEISRKT